ncbi:MAG: hypothetical protein ACLFNO_00750 [Parcubacteria group bacterium]
MSEINLFKFENNNFNLKDLLLFWRKNKKHDKSNVHILFVDDEDFAIVSNLKKAGWVVDKIKDLKNIEDEVVKRAQIIFVDFKGVGKTLSENEEGIGIIKSLKNTYKDSKRVILYSGHNRFSLKDDIKSADNYLAKNSDTYEFIKIITEEISKLK